MHCILHYKQGEDSLAGIPIIIYISVIIYYISHFAVYRNKFSAPFSRKNLPRESHTSKTHFAFHGRK